MPDYNIPMMAAAHIDPSVPLNAKDTMPLQVTPFENIDPIANSIKAYKLAESEEQFKENQADRLEKQRDREERDRDKTLIDQYMKSGGDVNTPQGLNMAMKELKGKLSQKGFANLEGISNSKRLYEIKYREGLNQLREDDLKTAALMQEESLKTMSAPLLAYEKAKEKGGEEAGQKAFQAAKAATLEMMKNQVTPYGEPMYPPQVLAQFESVDPEDLKHQIDNSIWKRSIIKESIETNYKKALTQESAERVKASGKKAEFDEKKLQLLKEKIEKQGATELTDEDAATLAEMVRVNGPSALSRFGMSEADRKKVLSVVTKLNTGEGITAREGAAAVVDIGSTKKSLDKMVPQLDAITAFEKTAESIGGKLVEIAKKVDSSGVPVVERWIRAGRKSVEGDPDVTELNARMQTFRTEAARIINNPNLTGVLSDSARHEVEDIMPSASSAEQIERGVEVLMSEAATRRKLLADQIEDAKGRVKKGAAKTPASAPPAGFPSVSKEEQGAKDSEAIAIMKQELQAEKEKLPTIKDPAELDRTNKNIAALEREIAVKSKTATPEASPKKEKGAIPLDAYLKSKGF